MKCEATSREMFAKDGGHPSDDRPGVDAPEVTAPWRIPKAVPVSVSKGVVIILWS